MMFQNLNFLIFDEKNYMLLNHEFCMDIWFDFLYFFNMPILLQS